MALTNSVSPVKSAAIASVGRGSMSAAWEQGVEDCGEATGDRAAVRGCVGD
ncbi:MAG: hypothetical protein Q8Q09_08680 [Deltaproteobacteria bacterium]|nr:hypothetical protein [Deltaproteobacteria bacterium]